MKTIDKMWEAIASDIQAIKALPDDIEIYVDNKYRQSVLTPKNIIGVNSEMVCIDYGLGDSRVIIVKGDLEEFSDLDERHIKPEARLMVEDVFTFKKAYNFRGILRETDFLERY